MYGGFGLTSAHACQKLVTRNIHLYYEFQCQSELSARLVYSLSPPSIWMQFESKPLSEEYSFFSFLRV